MRDLIWSETSAGEPRLTRGGIYLLLGLVVLILGVNWPIMATGMRAITPFWMTVFRCSRRASTPVPPAPDGCRCSARR